MTSRFYNFCVSLLISYTAYHVPLSPFRYSTIKTYTANKPLQLNCFINHSEFQIQNPSNASLFLRKKKRISDPK